MSCSHQITGPNGNDGADGMVSVIAHELAETVSDPVSGWWRDSDGEENADVSGTAVCIMMCMAHINRFSTADLLVELRDHLEGNAWWRRVRIQHPRRRPAVPRSAKLGEPAAVGLLLHGALKVLTTLCGECLHGNTWHMHRSR